MDETRQDRELFQSSFTFHRQRHFYPTNQITTYQFKIICVTVFQKKGRPTAFSYVFFLTYPFTENCGGFSVLLKDKTRAL